jgi:hypothetical protein
MTESALHGACEILPGKLYFATLRTDPQQTNAFHFFSVDGELNYEPFFADFGPLSLGCLYRFCNILNEKLKHPDLASKKIVFYTSHDAHKRANGAVLIGAYSVLYCGKTADEAFLPFKEVYPPFVPFRDAAMGICTFNLTVQDCLRAVHKANILKWLDFSTFDLDQYEYYEQVEAGDLNEIVPGKFIAFSGPAAKHLEAYDGSITLGPEDYVPVFKKFGVSAVIRLNKKVYDKKGFVDEGIKHYDLYFVDGGTPSEAIVRRFCEVCETEPGCIAVHCKAGLGRTGVLIGCYLMKHFHLTAHEVIAWLRMARPGSVIGPQQHFLADVEERLWRMGEIYRRQHGGPPPGGPIMLPSELWPRALKDVPASMPMPLASLQNGPVSIEGGTGPRNTSSAIQARASGARTGAPPRDVRMSSLTTKPMSGYSYSTPHRNDLLSSPTSRITGMRGRAKLPAPPPSAPTLSTPSTRTAVYAEASNPPHAVSQPARY